MRIYARVCRYCAGPAGDSASCFYDKRHFVCENEKCRQEHQVECLDHMEYDWENY